MIEVLFRNEEWIAINKPSGMLVHPSPMANDRVTAMSALRDHIGQKVYPIHRLDRGTSGVLVFGLTPAGATSLAQAMSAPEAAKRYWAVVRGYAPESGLIDKPLSILDDDGAKTDEAHAALTRYRRLARIEFPDAVGKHPTTRYSLVEAEIETGRTHQIRRHLQSISHPLIGDVTYGDGKHNRYFREKFGVQRLLLHARELVLSDGARPITIRAPLPEEFERLLSKLGWLSGL